MARILLCDRAHHSLDTLKEILPEHETIEVDIATDPKNVLEMSKLTSYDLIFLDVFELEEECFKNIEKVQQLNAESIIIAVGAVEDDTSREIQKKLLQRGAVDYINRQISIDLLRLRLQNYLDIIELRKQRLFSTKSVNLFDRNVYSRTLVFTLASEKGLVQFWDYLMRGGHYQHQKLEDATRVLYGLSSWLYRNHLESSIYLEENREALYLTLMPVDLIRDRVIEDIIQKYAGSLTHKHDFDRLSIKLDFEPSPLSTVAKEQGAAGTIDLDDETKSILGKTHFNKVTARDFVESTAISLMSKIDALEEVEDRIDELLIGFEDDPTLEKLKEVSNAFISYAEVVELMVEFDHLVFAIKTLAEAISNITEDQFAPKEIKKFVTLSLHLVHDLSTWRDNLFIKQEANDIHYLDSSLLSSCLQIEAIFAKKEIEEEEDDFELF